MLPSMACSVKLVNSYTPVKSPSGGMFGICASASGAPSHASRPVAMCVRVAKPHVARAQVPDEGTVTRWQPRGWHRGKHAMSPGTAAVEELREGACRSTDEKQRAQQRHGHRPDSQSSPRPACVRFRLLHVSSLLASAHSCVPPRVSDVTRGIRSHHRSRHLCAHGTISTRIPGTSGVIQPAPLTTTGTTPRGVLWVIKT